MVLSVLFSLLGLAVPVGLVVLAVVTIRRRGQDPSGSGAARGVRRFFQYLLLLALTVIAAIGVADLLGRLLGADAPGGETLARTLSFTLVGLPLAALLAWWTRRTILSDHEEGASSGYAAYLTLAALITLVVAATALQGVLSALLRGHFDGGALATFLVWGALWFLHWVLARRTLGERGWPHLLLGSLVGLVWAVVALGLLLGASLEALLLDGGDQVVVGTTRQLAGHGAALAVGALVWSRYWLTTAARLPRTTPWLVYVLPIGVGGGLVLAVGAASLLLWQLLVWLLGDPAGPAREHFADSPGTFAFAVAGLLAWWYHRAVLAETGEARTEVRRVHEYLVAAIGLLAAASGVGMVIVAAIESLTPGIDLGVSVLNTLLGALTLLVVGVPVWWTFWRRIRRALAADPVPEVSSPTRRTYLVLLFGIAGVAAVVALIVAVFVLLQDVLAGLASGETVRTMRYALGVLVAAAAVSAYHGAVYREDREVALPATPAGPRSVLLVGAPAPGLENAIRHATGAHVELLARADGAAPPWSEETLLAAIADHAGEDLVVLPEDDVLRVIPVQGRR
ncbi:MAG: DUF5671 domain-containing protein [Actinomycetota bacterium]